MHPSQYRCLERPCCSQIGKIRFAAVPEPFEYTAFQAALLWALPAHLGEPTTETRSSSLDSETKTDLAATARKFPKNLVKSAGKRCSCPLTTDQETETQNVSMPYLRFHNQFEMVGRIQKKKKICP